MKRRVVQRVLMALAALALTTLLFACGGGSSSTANRTPGNGATLSGTAQ